jgi:hypothetical protein
MCPNEIPGAEGAGKSRTGRTSKIRERYSRKGPEQGGQAKLGKGIAGKVQASEDKEI